MYGFGSFAENKPSRNSYLFTLECSSLAEVLQRKDPRSMVGWLLDEVIREYLHQTTSGSTPVRYLLLSGKHSSWFGLVLIKEKPRIEMSTHATLLTWRLYFQCRCPLCTIIYIPGRKQKRSGIIQDSAPRTYIEMVLSSICLCKTIKGLSICGSAAALSTAPLRWLRRYGRASTTPVWGVFSSKKPQLQTNYLSDENIGVLVILCWLDCGQYG